MKQVHRVKIKEPIIDRADIGTKRKKPNKLGGKRPGSGQKPLSQKADQLIHEEAEKELAYRRLLKEQILDAMPEKLRFSPEDIKEALEEINETEISDLARRRIWMHSNSILNAQISAATGEKYLYKVVHTKNNKGKTVKKNILVTDPDEIKNFLDHPMLIDGEDYYFITVRKPDTGVGESLLNRLMGKPPTVVTGPKNKDGSDGGFEVSVVNFSGADVQQVAHKSAQVVGEVIKDAVITEEHDTEI